MDLDEVMLCVDWRWCHIGSCSTCSLAHNPRAGHHDLDGHTHHTPLEICSLSGGIGAMWRGRTIISLSMPLFCAEALAGRYKISFWTCWSSIKVYWVKFTGRVNSLLLNALHKAWQRRAGRSSRPGLLLLSQALLSPELPGMDMENHQLHSLEEPTHFWYFFNHQ